MLARYPEAFHAHAVWKGCPGPGHLLKLPLQLEGMQMHTGLNEKQD